MKSPRLIFGSITRWLSLSLCLLSIVLWIRSYFVEDMWHRTGNGWEYIKISGGAISYWLDGYIDPDEQWKHERWAYDGWRQRGEIWSQYGLHVDYIGHAHLWDASISFAMLTVFTAVIPVAFVFRRWRNLRRIAAGLCPRCCYDLRATPSRCPECGFTRT